MLAIFLSGSHHVNVYRLGVRTLESGPSKRCGRAGERPDLQPIQCRTGFGESKSFSLCRSRASPPPVFCYSDSAHGETVISALATIATYPTEWMICWCVFCLVLMQFESNRDKLKAAGFG